MTGIKTYYNIPFLTRFFRIRFYIWSGNLFTWSRRIGLKRDSMTFDKAIMRLCKKNIY